MEDMLKKVSIVPLLDFIASVNERTDPITRVRSHSVVLICVLFIAITVGLSASAIAEFGWSNERLPGPIAIFLYLFALWLLHRGHGPFLASVLVIATCYIATFVFVSLTEGLHSYGVSLLIAGPYAAAFFLGARASMIMCAASWLAIWYFWATVDPLEQWTPFALFMKAAVLSGMTFVVALFSLGFAYTYRVQSRELMRTNQKLESASQAKSTFLANMSHEIRTPLNGVLGMAQALAAGDLRQDQKVKVETLLDSGKTLMALVNDVLDISKIEAGKLELNPAPACLRDVLTRVGKLFEPRAADKGLTLRLHVDAAVPVNLIFDAVRVRQCVTNLISNAIKFTDRGRVDVYVGVDRLASGADWLVTMKVRDTGIGMDEQTMKRLFAEFSQADSSMTRRFGGTGLGLAITRKLARAMGGNTTAKSRVGDGSIFTLTFRADDVPEDFETGGLHAASGQGAGQTIRGRHVLLVDDQPVNRSVTRFFLEPHDMLVSEAENGQSALDMLASQHFDIMLLDIHMPVLDGEETIRRIRQSGEKWADIPVIAITADAMSGDREKFLAMGMNGYIAKPIDAQQLISEITRTLYGTDIETDGTADEDRIAGTEAAEPEAGEAGAKRPVASSVPPVDEDLERMLADIKVTGSSEPGERPAHLKDLSDEAYEKLKADWLSEAQGQYELMLSKMGDPEARSPDLQALHRIFHDCKSQAPLFGFTLMADIADGFCLALRSQRGKPSQEQLDQALNAIQVLHALLTRRLEGDGGKAGEALRRHVVPAAVLRKPQAKSRAPKRGTKPSGQKPRQPRPQDRKHG